MKSAPSYLLGAMRAYTYFSNEDEDMTRRPINLLLEAETYEHLKDLASSQGTSVSALVDGFMREKLKELTGQNPAGKEAVDYDALKLSYEKLCSHLDTLENGLRKKNVYDSLTELALRLSLKYDLSNLEEVVPCLLTAWTKEDRKHILEEAHLFVNFLEVARQKKALERQLTALRGGTITAPSPKLDFEEAPFPQDQLKTPTPSFKEAQDWKEETEEDESDDEEEEEEWEEEEAEEEEEWVREEY